VQEHDPCLFKNLPPSVLDRDADVRAGFKTAGRDKLNQQLKSPLSVAELTLG
jgi:hypothetical protein